MYTPKFSSVWHRSMKNMILDPSCIVMTSLSATTSDSPPPYVTSAPIPGVYHLIKQYYDIGNFNWGNLLINLLWKSNNRWTRSSRNLYNVSPVPRYQLSRHKDESVWRVCVFFRLPPLRGWIPSNRTQRRESCATYTTVSPTTGTSGTTAHSPRSVSPSMHSNSAAYHSWRLGCQLCIDVQNLWKNLCTDMHRWVAFVVKHMPIF